MKVLAVIVFIATITLGVIHLATRHEHPAAAAARVQAYSQRRTLPGNPNTELEREQQAAQLQKETVDQQYRLEMNVKIGVTLVAGLICAIIALRPASDASAKHFAYTTIGTIVGFWLGGSN